jgi:hypothetical protein
MLPNTGSNKVLVVNDGAGKAFGHEEAASLQNSVMAKIAESGIKAAEDPKALAKAEMQMWNEEVEAKKAAKRKRQIARRGY